MFYKKILRIVFHKKSNWSGKVLKVINEKKEYGDLEYTTNVIPVKITDNPRTDPCTICVKCKYYRDYLYHDMPVIVI